jgi:hypothetical protein
MPPSFAFPIVFFIFFCGFLAVRGYREWHAAKNNLPRKLVILIGGACVLAFCEPFWINFFPPALLEHFELPNAPGGDRLTAPDGRVFIVSWPIARVQRYGPEGFELGFMYGSKASKVWMSPSGNILICTMRGALLTYSPDGTEVPPSRSCNDRFDVYLSSSPSHARVPTIAFNWVSAIAVPLWHPVAAWLTALLVGLFSLGLSRRPTS